jgi:hypothetical protein
MKRNHRLINWVLFVSMVGALALTASTYVGCGSFESDEYLDLAQVSPNPVVPILACHWKTRPLYLRFLKTFCFQRANLLTNLLRC